MLKSRRLVYTLAATGLAATFVASAHGASIATGPDNTGTDNVLFNDGGDTGLTVQGHLNNAPTVFVNFTSTTQLEAAGGQADIQPDTAAFFTDITTAMADPGTSMLKIVFNVDITNGAQNATINVKALNHLNVEVLNSNQAVGNGSNFFTVTAGANEFLSSLMITYSGPADTGITSYQQIRIGTADTPVVPLPASAYAGLGLLAGLAGLRKMSARRAQSLI